MTEAVKNIAAAKDIEHGKRVLMLESEALTALAKSLDHHFVAAIEAIQKMKDAGQGRLIVAGIGKSGHVARKIAATLASTGTPSYYIHPGEASHGDLGMIAQSDVIILLSNSGKNAELMDMIDYSRRFRIPLIAITSDAESPLAQHSDIPLVMPKMPEACPNGLAPTTSTTMMLALGDAIAITLLERMGLTAEEFRVWHPGGKLGQKLRKVSDMMYKNDELPIVAPDTTMAEALLVLTAKNLGSLIVATPENILLGIITDGDLKRHMGPDLLQKKVSEIMTANPKTIAPGALAAEAMDIMVNQFKTPITTLVVADQTKSGPAIAGLIRIQELLRAGLV